MLPGRQAARSTSAAFGAQCQVVRPELAHGYTLVHNL